MELPCQAKLRKRIPTTPLAWTLVNQPRWTGRRPRRSAHPKRELLRQLAPRKMPTALQKAREISTSAPMQPRMPTNREKMNLRQKNRKPMPHRPRQQVDPTPALRKMAIRRGVQEDQRRAGQERNRKGKPLSLARLRELEAELGVVFRHRNNCYVLHTGNIANILSFCGFQRTPSILVLPNPTCRWPCLVVEL
ncbi:hypothetical protein I7I50_12474 [Histoplasma capsulatum G186AR]|uniref:Uncharacterized protein n=1 Tax=Ajellomyces capsulatus TaxID=5037 RepID=A0A8H7YCQ8_AJECA|nr:hypothetical protein I7I52_11219 [Histoplasma capsulatum]QSS70742.1 hypothetical protein I7I50_12474 [Histoplasma capsulatum G186AR]